MAKFKLNIFKIKEEYTYEQIKEILNIINKKKTYIEELIEKEIVHGINNYKISYLYALDRKRAKEVEWKIKIDNLFEKEESKRNSINKESYSNYGFIVVNSNIDNYIITFGRANNSINELIDLDFGLDIASKAMNRNSINLTSSKFYELIKNKSIIEYSNASLNASFAESIDYIVGELKEQEKHSCIKDLLQIINKKVEFNISVKVTVKDDEFSLDNLCKIIYNLKTIQNKYDPQVNIPRLNAIKEKEQDLVIKLDEELNEQILNSDEGSVNFSFYKLKDTEFIFYGSGVEYLIYSGKNKSEVLDVITIEDIRNFMIDYKIDDIDKVKVKIFKDGFGEENEEIRRLLDCTIQLDKDENYYCLNEGKWFRYNKEYIKIINGKLENIKETKIINFDDKFNYLKKEFTEYKEKNNDEFKKVYGEKINYNENKYNFKIANENSYIICDRNINSLGLEICDLYINNEELAHVKIGGPQEFSKCIDQSIEGMICYKNANKELKKEMKEKLKIENVKCISLILIVKSNEVWNSKDISNFKSLGFKIKLIDWYEKVIENKYMPKIIISKELD